MDMFIHSLSGNTNCGSGTSYRQKNIANLSFPHHFTSYSEGFITHVFMVLHYNMADKERKLDSASHLHIYEAIFCK